MASGPPDLKHHALGRGPFGSMADLDDPQKYVRVDDVNIFDEHEEHDKNGKVVERFDRARLEKMAKKANARDRGGQLSPITIGHTSDDAREEEQPEIVGYGRTYHVAYDDKLDPPRYVIRTKFYIRRDSADEAAKYPRVSIERYPDDDTIDPIAILKRTPKRDVGQWCYVAGGKKVRYSMGDFDKDTDKDTDDDRGEDRKPGPDPVADVGQDADDDGVPDAQDTDDDNDGVPDEQDATPKGEGEGLSDEDKAALDRYMRHHPPFRYLKDCYDKDGGPEKYEAGAAPAVPSPTNATTPGSRPPMKNARATEETLADRMARETPRKKSAPAPAGKPSLEQRVAALEKERNQAVERYQMSECKRLVEGLKRHVVIGTKEEEADLVQELMPLSEDKREKKIKYLRARLERNPAPPDDDGDDMLHLGDEDVGQPRREMTESQLLKANQYTRAHPGCPWEEAERYGRGIPNGQAAQKK